MKLLFLCALVFSFCAGIVAQRTRSKTQSNERARVTGIGGIFFKAQNPKELTRWYATNLGLNPPEGAPAGVPAIFEWRDKDNPATIGATVWAAFPKTTKYFDPTRAEFMVNYRVNNLDAMLRQLREAGVKVDEKTSGDDNGRFGWATDPEGNRFELWEPK